MDHHQSIEFKRLLDGIVTYTSLWSGVDTQVHLFKKIYCVYLILPCMPSDVFVLGNIRNVWQLSHQAPMKIRKLLHN